MYEAACKTVVTRASRVILKAGCVHSLILARSLRVQQRGRGPAAANHIQWSSFPCEIVTPLAFPLRGRDAAVNAFSPL
jgi:hypothetical protein